MNLYAESSAVLAWFNARTGRLELRHLAGYVRRHPRFRGVPVAREVVALSDPRARSTATMNAWLGGDDSVVWPAAAASTACLALNAGLFRHLLRLERSRTGGASH